MERTCKVTYGVWLNYHDSYKTQLSNTGIKAYTWWNPAHRNFPYTFGEMIQNRIIQQPRYYDFNVTYDDTINHSHDDPVCVECYYVTTAPFPLGTLTYLNPGEVFCVDKDGNDVFNYMRPRFWAAIPRTSLYPNEVYYSGNGKIPDSHWDIDLEPVITPPTNCDEIKVDCVFYPRCIDFAPIGNPDGIVNIHDVGYVSSNWQKRRGGVGWGDNQEWIFDLNHDGIIDTKETSIFGRRWQWKYF